MRVLYWADGFWPQIGGIEVRAARLLADLSRRGHEFTVIAAHSGLDLPDVDRFGKIPVHRFRFWEALQPGNLDAFATIQQRISDLKRRIRPEIVHADFLGPSSIFHLATRSAHPAPLLVTIQQHGTLTAGGGPDSLLYGVLRAADWVTFCSRFMRDETLRLIREIPAPNSIVPNAVRAPILEPTPPRFDPPRLLCLGRLRSEKGFDLAVQALARLGDRHGGTRLAVAGDGPDLEGLRQEAARMGVSDRTEFLGWAAPEDVPELILQASIVLVPSRREAFGLVALEAAMMGRPVVATAVGGLPEVIADGKTGVLVPPEDASALADAISRLLADPERCSRMGVEARRRALAEFEWERHVDAYDALYGEITKGSANATVG